MLKKFRGKIDMVCKEALVDDNLESIINTFNNQFENMENVDLKYWEEKIPELINSILNLQIELEESKGSFENILKAVSKR